MTHLERERENYPGWTDQGIINLHCPEGLESSPCGGIDCEECWNIEIEEADKP